MPKSEFKIQPATKVTKADALTNAKEKDARNANFHIPANTDEILTLDGDFYESVWTRGNDTGTMLLAGAKRADNKTTIQVPFGFFRTKQLREEDGFKTFTAAFSKDATFEEIVKGISKGKKIQVKRSPYVYPGRSAARDIDTVIFVN